MVAFFDLQAHLKCRRQREGHPDAAAAERSRGLGAWDEEQVGGQVSFHQRSTELG